MDPPGGLTSERDKQLVLHTEPLLALQVSSQQPQHATAHQIAAQPQQAASTTIATSPAAAALIAATAGGHHRNNSAGSQHHTMTPALAAAATTYSAATQAATAFSGTSVGHHLSSHHHHHHGHQQQLHAMPLPTAQLLQHNTASAASSLLGGLSSSSGSGSSGQQQTIDKLSRPMAFDKMESLVREMQDPEHGVPVRQQKMFLTSIPYAFMGYDLIEWLMDRLLIEESEALNIANQLCLHGYFFPVNDSKTLTVKDDSSLYRFQTPYYWPWQHKVPDNVEYAIYLAKRSLRNKQRHALEDYEAEALASLHKNLKGKWDFISMQAEEQVRLAKERKKGDKIVGDSQERAYWRVHRPPPGQFTPLEPCPIPSRDRLGAKPNKKKTLEDVQREVDYLNKSLNRTRMKMSQACESLTNYSETFVEYDFFLQPVLPSNPWVTEDVTFWQLNNTFVDIPTEKRVKRWAISIEELVADPTGLQEFTTFLEKEYSHENIRFWIAVNRLRRSAHSQVARKVNEIYEEFLKPGAPCEINIDGKTMESVLRGLKQPSRFTFDSASEHIYMLLLKKDTYPRFVRSDHYKRLLESGIQPSHKKRFFNFGGVSGAKKKMTAALSGQAGGDNSSSASKGGLGGGGMMAPPPGSLGRRRGSDRSLTGSAHELAVIGVNKDAASKVPHSHSQSNLSEIPYSCESIYRGDMPQSHHHLQQQQLPQAQRPQLMIMSAADHLATTAAATLGGHHHHTPARTLLETHQETPKPKPPRLETTIETASSAVCPWDMPDEPPSMPAPPPVITAAAQVQLSVCPWEQDEIEETPEPSPSAVPGKANTQRLTSTSSDISDVSERMQRNLGIRHQNTVDSGEAGVKRLMPNFTEQRRASVSFTPSRISEYQFGRPTPSVSSTKMSTTPSPTVGSQTCVVDTCFPPLFTPLQAQQSATIGSSGSGIITKDPPSSSDTEIDEELHKLSISDRNSQSSASALHVIPISAVNPTPSITKITPPPAIGFEEISVDQSTVRSSYESPHEEALSVALTPSNPGSSVGSSSETEIEPHVHEVKIELIEAGEHSSERTTQKLLEVVTLTLEVQEPVDSSWEPASENHNRTPTKICSARQSPEQELTIIATTEQDLPCSLVLNLGNSSPPLPSPPLPSPPPPPPPVEKSTITPSTPPDEPTRSRDPEVESLAGQEELSPTTDEYQEGLQFGESKDAYDYDIVDTDSRTGYIAPAPTPAPSMAPLAEIDVDTVDDEPCDDLKCVVDAGVQFATTTTASNVAAVGVMDDVKKRRKKRNSDGKRMASLEEKDKDKASTSAAVGECAKAEADRNAVCPWEDENVTTSDGTFVKTYATLGYL